MAVVDARGASWSAERCARVLRKAKLTGAGYWKACCPAHEDDEPSLLMSDGEDGGLILRCYAGCEYRSIVSALECSGAVIGRPQREQSMPTEHYQFGRWHAHWDYHDARGRPILRVCRWNRAEGKKHIRPIYRDPATGWKWAHHPSPRPLYQLDRLANEPDLPVLLVEGEKTADAAQQLFPLYIASTWPGGAAAMGEVDMGPLRGRAMVLWPDNDEAGRKAMEWWRTHLTGVAASVLLVDPADHAEDLPPKWDLWDARQEGRDVSWWIVDAQMRHDQDERNFEIIGEGLKRAEQIAQEAERRVSMRGPAAARIDPPEPEVAPEPPARPGIILAGGQLHLYGPQAEDLLREEVYVRGQRLVRIGGIPELGSLVQGAIERDSRQRVIVPVSIGYLRHELTARAEFVKPRAKGEGSIVDCPADLAQHIRDRGDWRAFRQLLGLTSAPFLRRDGTICEAAGYDDASGVFMSPNAEFPAIPASPVRDDALAAIDRLIDPFTEFPFESAAMVSAFLAHVLAAVSRQAMDTCPAFVYTAPMAGSGKTLLAEMPSIIAGGVRPGVRAFSDESEEMRKVLMSILLAGDPTALFDNVPTGAKVRSAELCRFVTADVYSDRKLGASEDVSLPNQTIVVLTGNNITPAADLVRRCLTIRLDANQEKAAGREYKIADLKAHVHAHRPRLLVDALIVLRAYALARERGEAPKMPAPVPSFERFSRVAREPLLWLGWADPVETQESEGEDEIGPLIEAFERLAATDRFSPGEKFKASDIAKHCQLIYGEALADALTGSGCSNPKDGIKVGFWLREHKGKVAGKLKLVAGKLHRGTGTWSLEARQ